MTKIIDRTELMRVIDSIPLLSQSAALLLQLSANTKHEMKEIIDVVRFDSSLTVHVLRVVNSAAFGLRQSIDSIDRAVTYLGERMVVGIALNDSAGVVFDKKLDGYEGQRGDLWRHDLRAAIASREVAHHAKSEINPDLAFTGGLLHDIGKSVISDFLRGSAHEVLDRIEAQQAADYLAAERAMIGIDHTEAGLELAKRWNLPEALQMVIRHHHHPQQAPEEYQTLIYSVHLGDTIAMMGGGGTGADTLHYQLDGNYTQFLDLTSANLALILLDVEEEFRRLTNSLAEN